MSGRIIDGYGFITPDPDPGGSGFGNLDYPVSDELHEPYESDSPGWLDVIVRRSLEAAGRALDERIREENSPAEIERLGKLFGTVPHE